MHVIYTGLRPHKYLESCALFPQNHQQAHTAHTWDTIYDICFGAWTHLFGPLVANFLVATHLAWPIFFFIVVGPSPEVTNHTLQWSFGSFRTATIVGTEVIVSNLGTACNCGLFPKKPRAKRARKPKQKLQTKKTTEESDSDLSESSLLGELAKLVEEYQNLEDTSEESDSEPESQDVETTARKAMEKLKLEKLSKVKSLSTAVCSSEQYREEPKHVPATSALDMQIVTSSSSSSSGHIAPSKSSPAKDFEPVPLKAFQRVEEALDGVLVKEAIKTLKAKSENKQFPTAQLESLMQEKANQDVGYTGLQFPEEVVQQGLVDLAESLDAKQLPNLALSSTAQNTGHSELAMWAGKLQQTASSFQACQDTFFKLDGSTLTVSPQLDRCISLVQFLLPADDLGHETQETPEKEIVSLVQFVSWDSVRSKRGRRLRIERGRFVWCPPGRFINGRHADDLSDKFNAGARIIIADCGATLVKQRGQFRTEVPPNILSVYQTLVGATQDQAGASTMMELDRCFVCQQLVGFMCPICKLRSHEDCCQSLAVSCIGSLLVSPGCECEDEDSKLRVAVASAYRANTSDLDGSKLLSIVHFDSADQVANTGRLVDLLGSACLLCSSTFAVLQDHGQTVFRQSDWFLTKTMMSMMCYTVRKTILESLALKARNSKFSLKTGGPIRTFAHSKRHMEQLSAVDWYICPFWHWPLAHGTFLLWNVVW